jgi:hypothetical protein
LQELEITNPKDDHVVVTSPDRFYNDAITVLLVDWSADLVNQALNAIRGSRTRIAIHIFDYNDSNYTWLLDVANQADIIGINLNSSNHIDLFKGVLVSKSKSFHFGRLDVSKIYLNSVNDPIGELLIRIGTLISQMEEK